MQNFKSFIYTCIKISIVIFSIDILVFIMIVFLSMSDSKSPDIARVLFFILQHILSLPLSLLNDNLPFYLEYRELPNFIFISLPTNILLQSILCFAIIKVVKWSITNKIGVIHSKEIVNMSNTGNIQLASEWAMTTCTASHRRAST